VCSALIRLRGRCLASSPGYRCYGYAAAARGVRQRGGIVGGEGGGGGRGMCRVILTQNTHTHTHISASFVFNSTKLYKIDIFSVLLTHTQTHKHTNTHTHKHTNTHTNTHTHTHTLHQSVTEDIDCHRGNPRRQQPAGPPRYVCPPSLVL